MTEINKYIKSENIEVERSSIHFANYNPRNISDEAKRTLKKGIKKFGLVGGIVVNKHTGMTVVSGHQRLSVMDDLNKYPANDYMIRVDVINVDEKSEKELNILMNNPKAMGEWDYDALAQLMPEIDYLNAGLTKEDLNLIGCDYLLQTDQENNLANELSNVMQEVDELNEEEKAKRQLERANKVAHMKDVKQQVQVNAEKKAQDIDAYIMLSFDTYEAKVSFIRRFGFDKDDKFIKGEIFDSMIERVE